MWRWKKRGATTAETISPDSSEIEEYKSDERLRTAIENVPVKNITFSAEDIKNVLKVFDVVKLMVSEKNITNIDMKSATVTVEMLSEHSYYSQLTSRKVYRWHGTRDKVHTKPGRKIDVSFEAEVWGKLMLCIFERSSTNVSFLISVCTFLTTKIISYHVFESERTHTNATSTRRLIKLYEYL